MKTDRLKKASLGILALAITLARATGADSGAPARPLTELEQEQEISLEFETPHTAWARPWSGGPVRALFFAPYHSGRTDAREIVELAQRFDLRADAAYYGTRNERWLGEVATRPGFWPRSHYEERWAALEAAEYDLYVFLALEPRLLPEAMLERVRRAVAAGAGAVLVGAGGGELLRGDETPADAGNGVPEGAYMNSGAGRLALLPAREPVPFGLGWETEYDYRSQERGRALLWAAGARPRMTLEAALPGDGRLPALEAADGRLAWEEAPEGTVIGAALRREDGDRLELAPLAVSGRGEAALALPPLRAGHYQLELVARSRDGVENWAASRLEVISPVRGEVTLELDRPWADPEADADAAVSGRAYVSGGTAIRTEEQSPGYGTVIVRLRDRRGRILVRHRLPAAETRFRLPVADWMPMLLWAEAVLVRGDAEVAASGAQPFQVTGRRRDEFNFVMWGAPGGELGPYAVESLAREGVSVILETGAPDLSLAAHGIAYMPYAAWLGAEFSTLSGSLGADGVMLKTGCYNDPERFGNFTARVAASQQQSRRHGTIAYSLGDENAVRGSCLHPACLEAYRGYLGLKYAGDIAALNESWGSDYGSFAEVALLEPEQIPAPDAPEWFREWYAERMDFIGSRYPNMRRPAEYPMDEAVIRAGDINDELGALQAGNFARWYDRQAFQAWNLVQAVKRFDIDFKELDPLALTGFEGTNSFAIPRNPTRIRQGGDIDLMMREFGWWGPYRGPGNEVIRSLADPEYPRGNWFGYFRDVRRPLGRFWGMVNADMTMTQWWRWSGVGRFHGLLAPHLAPYRNRRAILDDMAPVLGDGLGSLLNRSRMIDDGVMLYYSLPSTYIAHFDGNESYGTYERSHTAWHNFIRDAGVQFRYLSDRQLRRGEFDPGEGRLLVLPMALAIGDEEAALIREFVARGGTLVADVRPGAYTGRCRPRPAGVLDDVFGISRKEGGSAAAAAAIEIPGLLSWPGGLVDPSVAADTGQALGSAGDAPALIVSGYGAGRAVLLNFPVAGAPAGALVADLLEQAGVRAPLALHLVASGAGPDADTDADTAGADIDDQLEAPALGEAPHVRRWRNGEIELVSLTSGADMELAVTLPEERYVYDLRHRRSLGRVRTFPVKLEADRTGFLALLPRESPAPAIAPLSGAAGEISISAGTLLEAAVSVPGAAGLHALRLQALDPNGRPVDYFDQVVIAGGEPRTVRLPFAWNDRPGRWLIRVTDLYTGESARLRVNLR